MDNHKEQFIEEDKIADAIRQGRDIGKERFHVGQEVNVNGIAFVVRKVTLKDLILRPKKWKQGADKDPKETT